jgi:hypothetical protein
MSPLPLHKIVGTELDECPHDEVVEDQRFASGTITGRCTKCGDNTFMIRDVGYENFRAALAAGEDFDEAMAKWRIDTVAIQKVIEPKKA